MSHAVLLIDDEAPLRSLLARILSLEQYQVTEVGTAKDALRWLEKEDFAVILCDVKLPDGNGVDLVPQFKKIRPASEVILLTAYGTIPAGVQAIQHGAFDYLTKGDDNERILPVVSRAAEKAMLQRRPWNSGHTLLSAASTTEAAMTDATALTLQVAPAPHQARGEVLQPCQLNLQLALVALGACREDLEDQHGAVGHRHAEMALEVALLRRRERLVEQHGLGTMALD